MNTKLRLYDLLNIIASKFGLRNVLNLLKKKGNLTCPNGFVISFDQTNKQWIKNLFLFSLYYGVHFSDLNGEWHYHDNKIETPSGIKFTIDRFDSLIFSETFLGDIHFSDFDLNDKIVVQAGGFTGDTALYYASRGAKVYSFEPDPNSYNLAIKNINLNTELSKKIVMKNYAIGADGEIDFPVNPSGSGGSSTFSLKNSKLVKVRSVSIGTIIKEFSLDSPYLLDLDIKGKEFEVIKDLSISKFSLIRIEYSTKILDKVIGTRKNILDKLQEYGFNKVRIFKHNELVYDLIEHGTIEAAK